MKLRAKLHEFILTLRAKKPGAQGEEPLRKRCLIEHVETKQPNSLKTKQPRRAGDIGEEAVHRM